MPQLLDKNADADSTGQLRGQVLAAIQELETMTEEGLQIVTSEQDHEEDEDDF